MKLIWKGVLSKHNPLPSPAVPSEAKKLFPENQGWQAYLLVVPILLMAYFCIVVRRPFTTGVVFTKEALFLGVGLSLLFLVAHELIHAVCCPKRAEVLVYVSVAGICLIPTCPLGKRRYIVMALMPALILGVCPLIIWLLLTGLSPLMSSMIFAFSIGSLSMCVGDLYNVILAARKMTFQSLLITSGNACFYYDR